MKYIRDYEGLYSITEDGQVWSHKRQIYLKPSSNGQGYLTVSLCKKGKTKTCKIHKMVAEAFLVNENPEELTDIGHKDNNKLNNHISNLEYVTHRDNVKHSARSGFKRVITPIRCIELNMTFPTQADAARALGIGRQGIVNVLAGKQNTAGGYHFERVVE